MFVAHIKIDGKTTSRDFGHVNQFFREYPLFRQAKDEEVFKECVERGFIYIESYLVKTFKGTKEFITYNTTLNALLAEVDYNRTLHTGRA